MKKGLYILLIVPFLATSCFKKLEGAESLNTNIYDVDYTGDVWFVINDAVEYLDQFANPKVRLECEIPEDATPTFKPTNFYYTSDVNGEDFGLKYEAMQEEGNYLIDVVVDPDPTDIYALTMGVWIAEDSVAINPFTVTIEIP